MAETAAKVMQTSVPSAAPMEMPSMSASSEPQVEVAQAQPAPAPQAPTTVQSAAQQPERENQAAPHYTGEPISVNLKDVDLQDFFRLIHEISGLNIVLDPAVKGTLTLVLDNVPWDQALDIVLQNNGLDRRLQGNVLRIATRETFTREADARRAQAEAQALAVDPEQYTHYLSYAHAADVVPLVKRFLTQRGEVLADPRTNALLIKDIPSVIPQVQRLLDQLDRKTQEVEIEARVVAATRNFARDIGTQLGFGWGNSTTAVGGAPAAGVSPISQTYISPPPYLLVPGFDSSQSPPKPQALPIPLFSNLPVQSPTSALSLVTSAAGYRVDAILTLAESRGLLKILSRPRVVTQNNIGATVKQGVRVPVVTAAQLGGPPTVTYVEAALRLQVTPQVTAENTIFLNVDVENTTPDFSRQVQGNPTLITQQATTSVLVNDGGTVVIGGVIQTQNSVNTNQVPLLGDVPLLGNLFKRRSVSTTTQELIFFITPKIVQT
jgi:type IV pilus assembly protein PilQ